MKTGFSLWEFPHRENPVFIQGSDGFAVWQNDKEIGSKNILCLWLDIGKIMGIKNLPTLWKEFLNGLSTCQFTALLVKTRTCFWPPPFRLLQSQKKYCSLILQHCVSFVEFCSPKILYFFTDHLMMLVLKLYPTNLSETITFFIQTGNRNNSNT